MKNKFSNLLLELILFIFILITIDNSNAEYRVYQFYVKSKNPIKEDNQAHLVTSSLDPIGYSQYHGGRDSLNIDLMRTWICPGNTGNYKEYCKSPYQKVLELTKN
jgi:hypothetical protein